MRDKEQERKERKRAYYREYMRNRRALRTPEQHEVDKERNRRWLHKWWASLTPEQRAAYYDKRREYFRNYIRQRRARRTPEQREADVAAKRRWRQRRREEPAGVDPAGTSPSGLSRS